MEESLKIRVWKGKKPTSPYILVYFNHQTGGYRMTDLDGNVYQNAKTVINSYANYPMELWKKCRDMGNSIVEIKANIAAEIAQKEVEKEAERKELQRQAEERARIEAEEETRRKALASSKDSMSVSPYKLIQSRNMAEQLLEQMKPGAYFVCINYKKNGFVELKKKAQSSSSLKVLAFVEREGKPTKSALLRFMSAIQHAYLEGAEIIGRTRAIKEFGQRLVDSLPHVQERVNLHYASAAPRRYYDRTTLLWAKANQK